MLKQNWKGKIALLKRFWYVDIVTPGFLGPFQNISIHCRWEKKQFIIVLVV